LTADGQLVFELRAAAEEPQGALVLLHGRGTDRHDLGPLLELLDPQRRLVGITPQGPLCLPPGGYHWYAVERVGYPEARSFGETYLMLARWLDALPQLTGVPWERTVLGGFSQGAVMAYALGLGQGRPSPAGIIALSGFIPTVPGWRIELGGREGLAVAISHGSLDPVIPVQFGRSAYEVLAGAKLDVIFETSPLAHTIDPAFVAKLVPWLAGLTAPTPSRHD
jgi:phospholipase/carboxylesterase